VSLAPDTALFLGKLGFPYVRLTKGTQNHQDSAKLSLNLKSFISLWFFFHRYKNDFISHFPEEEKTLLP
jgi:hypothetical protein